MNQIILFVAFFGSAVLSAEDVARKPKLFFVSTGATTSTLQTASVATCPRQPSPPARGGRGEPSPWTGWNQQEQFSLPPSTTTRLKENLWRARRLEKAGREDSSSTGSPPPRSPPPPPSQPPSQFQAHFAHRLER